MTSMAFGFARCWLASAPVAGAQRAIGMRSSGVVTSTSRDPCAAVLVLIEKSPAKPRPATVNLAALSPGIA
jgi:hypothetical protein